ncbi:glycosyltransferase family 39 protein [Tsukamurella sp. 8F]|uniref:ArnT family glycosyltransferase n=1 Tax=unclassified Tsukamurella TaxID=2633480 RepID=UPI0023B931B8|nr:MULTISPECIES: glycosyltransferase family 39 protein [unclassified Tsukamurella]MDF0530422.1 glycosyltransferase family 39 protein [Tsukamurella sp. 8J]MDF0587757.1 glycosyltransferase family 39 protein [Tsukamurella sp. 8F]
MTVTADEGPQRPPLEWPRVLPPIGCMVLLLTLCSNGYGFERDELYFRMLHPAWGYVDQPPLTPLLSHLAATLSDDAWVLRVPATVFAAGSVSVAVLITREFGGGRCAQTLCAWAYAFASFPLLMGHVLLTATPDLVFSPLIALFVIMVVRRRRPRWWLAAGTVAGLAGYNKLLIAMVVVALVLGVLLVGPRRALFNRWFVVGMVAALVLVLPNLAYQATHDWPQFTMGRALSAHNGSEVRITMWPFLLLLLGPPLVPVWVAGLVSLLRRPAWRPMRFVAVAFVIILVETFLAAGQIYYPFGLLAVVFAVGCVPTAEFLRRSRPWRVAAVTSIAVNAVISAVIGLPLVPVSVVGRTPIPAIAQTARDQIGWPTYAEQIATAYRSIPDNERARAVVIASNYGEAGALVRYGPALGLPLPYSGQNQLYFDTAPPAGTTTVIMVEAQLATVQGLFGTCTVVGRLDNRVGVDNEEQGLPIAICRQPTRPLPELWPDFQHYD